jgi:hypothetical protein
MNISRIEASPELIKYFLRLNPNSAIFTASRTIDELYFHTLVSPSSDEVLSATLSEADVPIEPHWLLDPYSTDLSIAEATEKFPDIKLLPIEKLLESDEPCIGVDQMWSSTVRLSGLHNFTPIEGLLILDPIEVIMYILKYDMDDFLKAFPVFVYHGDKLSYNPDRPVPLRGDLHLVLDVTYNFDKILSDYNRALGKPTYRYSTYAAMAMSPLSTSLAIKATPLLITRILDERPTCVLLVTGVDATTMGVCYKDRLTNEICLRVYGINGSSDTIGIASSLDEYSPTTLVNPRLMLRKLDSDNNLPSATNTLVEVFSNLNLDCINLNLTVSEVLPIVEPLQILDEVATATLDELHWDISHLLDGYVLVVHNEHLGLVQQHYDNYVVVALEQYSVFIKPHNVITLTESDVANLRVVVKISDVLVKRMSESAMYSTLTPSDYDYNQQMQIVLHGPLH